MKTVGKLSYLLLTALCCWLLGTATIAQAQLINFEVQMLRLERTNYGDCGLCGNPDPTWKPTWSDNGTTGGSTAPSIFYHFGEMSGTVWDVTADNDIVRNRTSTDATTINVAFEGFEKNCTNDNFTYSGGAPFGPCWSAVNDNRRCQTNWSIPNFRDNAPCTWHEWTSPWCGDFRIRARYRWTFASPPTINVHPTANSSLCSPSDVTLTVGAALSTIGSHNMAQNVRWQVSNCTSCPSGGCTWETIPGATGLSYTPPRIAGTRLYRAQVTSNCSADFNSNTSTSNCSRVTYHTMNGTTTAPVNFPAFARNGDNPPSLISNACGSSVLPSTSHTVSTLQPPAVGAVANLMSYTWSATGGTITGSGSAITWTAPGTPGSYSITATYQGTCGGTYSSTCNVNVTAPACGFAYVSPTGVDAVTSGGPSNPYATVGYAVQQIAATSIRHIRVEAGTINEPNPVVISGTGMNGLIIEGGYTVSAGNWTKDISDALATRTVLNCSGFENIDNNTQHRVGLRFTGVNNWVLQDITVNTTAVAGLTPSGRGRSNYGVLIQTCSGYTMLRVRTNAGAASGGSNGFGFLTNWGAGGNTGGAGGGGANGNGDPSSSAAGGAGSPGSGGPSGGGAGGTGGAGRDDCGGGSGGCPGSSPGCNGLTGNTGGTGGTGSGYAAGDRPANTALSNSSYYVPAGQAAGGGGGGGGGRGGGGGGSRGGRIGCVSCDGHNGGTGGNGGRGGGGGVGGFAGGSSFGVWAFNVSGETVTNPVFSAGLAGTGGNGANGEGGATGTAGTGGDCNGCLAGTRCSGNGGTGGTGGAGGRGQDGANGISIPYVRNGVSTAANTPPPTTVARVLYGATRGCRNSEITIQKMVADNWTLPTDFSIVNDRRDAPAGAASTSMTVASNTLIITTSTAALNSAQTLQVGTVQWPRQLYIGPDARPLPTLTLTPNTICVGGSMGLSATSWGTQVEYDWRIYSGINVTAPLWSSSLQSPTADLSALAAGIYTLRYRVREICCGWSAPVYALVTIVPDPTAPNPLVKGVAVNTAEVCAGANLTVNAATGGTGGTGTCVYEYRWANTDGVWSGWSTTIPNFVAAGTGVARIEARRNCNGPGCDISPSVAVEWDVVPQPLPGSVDLVQPADGIGCIGATAQVLGIPGQNGTGTVADVIEWRIGVSGGWNTYSGAFTTTAAGQYYFRTRRTATGPGCNTSAWWPNDGGAFLFEIVPDPIISTQPTASTICTGGTVTLSTAATGGTGTFSYQWQSNTTSCVSAFANIPGATGSSYNSPVLTVTTYYRAVISQTGAGCNTLTTNCVAITVNPDPVAQTINPSAAAVCVNGNVSATFSGGSGGAGVITNEYEVSTNAGGTWASYTPGDNVSSAVAGSGRIQFRTRRTATGAGCDASPWTVALIDVNPAPAITTQPVAATICESGTHSLSVAATGGVGALSYQWQIGTSSMGPWTNVGTNSTNYTTAALTATRWFRVQVSNAGAGCNTVTSSVVEVTVNPQPVSQTITKAPNAVNVCEATSVSATFTGGSGGVSPIDVYEYRFHDGVAWSAWLAYTPASPIATLGRTDVEVRTFRTSAAPGCVTSTANVASWSVVEPPAAAGAITGFTPVCNSAGSVPYSIAVVSGATSYDWQVLDAGMVDVTASVGVTNQGTNSVLMDFASLSPGSYTIRVIPLVTTPITCSGPAANFALTVVDVNSLTTANWVGGSTGNNWLVAANWLVDGARCVPTCGMDVFINNANVNQPVLNGTASVGSLTTQGSLLNPTTIHLGASAVLNICVENFTRVNNNVTINANPTSRIRFIGTIVPQGLYGLFTAAQNSRLGIVEVSNGADLEFSNTVMLRDLIIEDAGSSVTSNNNNLWVGGALEIEGGASYLPGSNTTYFDGAAPGFYSDLSGSVVLNNVIVEKTGNNLTLSSNMTLGTSGVLTLTSGLINANNFTLNVQNPSPTAAIQGASASSYLYNGWMRRAIQGSGLGNYVFPVGALAAYHPAGINWNYASDPATHPSVRVRLIPGVPPSDDYSAINGPGIDSCSYGEYTQSLNHGYWQVEGLDGGTSGHYDMTLFYGGGATNAPAPGTAITVVTRPGLGAWDLDGRCDNTSTLAAVRRTRMTGFSDKAIAVGDMPFPVELVHLRATPVENRAIAVEWTTLSERNNMGFAIERSLEPLAGFSEIGWRPGSINSTEALTYRMMDEAVEPGVRYFYRLRQVDLDGSANYSNTVEAMLVPGQLMNLAVYPNPTDGPLVVRYSLMEPLDVMVIQVFDELGKRVMAQDVQLSSLKGSLDLDLSGLSMGVYNVQVVAGGEIQSFRVVKHR